MSVNESLSAYSTTAASNTPAGSTNIGTDLDDHLRDIKKNIRLIGTNARSPTEPENVFGRFWLDTSGSGSSVAILKFGDLADWIPLFEIDGSANTAYAPADPALFVSSAFTLTANNGLSGAGAFTANRDIGMANLYTATATATNMTAVVDPYGRVVSFSTGTDPSGPATNAQVQDRSSTSVYVSPATAKHHLGIAKFFIVFDGSGTASLTSSYNISGVVRSAAGTYTINLDTGFTNTNYAVVGLLSDSNANRAINVPLTGKQAASFQIITGGGNSYAVADMQSIMLVGYGFHST